MPTVPEVSRERFETLIRESGLVENSILDGALKDAPESHRAKHIARHLMKRGLLTRFQAQQLLAGRSGGFILGQYRILDLVGQGGMGKVYKAEHMTMSRLVALKVLSADVTRTERARQLFRREVKAAARLVHPHIATAFDANEVNGRAFLVLEFIAGPSLSMLVREQGPLPIGQACEYLRQAALGLQHAHEHGMVHRDLKPSNLLVQPAIGRDTLEGGNLKIVDFGLALLADSNDDSLAPDRHIVLGTPDYLSPEQARDLRNVDIRSDLYSIGCTLYFLLTGHVPFPGGGPMDKLKRHASAIAEPVEELRPHVPPGVTAIVRKLMAKTPEGRFQAPRDLADALANYCELHPISWSGSRRETVVPQELPDEPAPFEEDPVDPSTGSTPGVALSGTISLAEFASVLEQAKRVPYQDYDLSDDGRGFRTKFIVAILCGFLVGAGLIVAATLWK